MKKVCVNTRDELLILDLDRVAFFKADGNYTHLNYISGQALMLNTGLSGVEKILTGALAQGTSPFTRLGRSLIINKNFLSNINLPKQYLVLSDLDNHSIKLSVPKTILKLLKDHFKSQFSH